MKNVLLATVALALTACSGSGGGGSSLVPENAVPGAGGSLSQLAAAPTGWKSCIPDSGFSNLNTLMVSGNQLTYRSINFNDASGSPCALADRSIETVALYSAETTGTNSTNPTTTNLNLLQLSTKMKPLSNGMANDFNTGTMCGFNDWVVDQWKEVSGTVCVPTPNVILHTVFKINGSFMQLGIASAGKDGTSEEKRMTDLGSTMSK